MKDYFHSFYCFIQDRNCEPVVSSVHSHLLLSLLGKLSEKMQASSQKYEVIACTVLKTTKDYRCYFSLSVSYPILGMGTDTCLEIDHSPSALPGAAHGNENSLQSGVLEFGAHVKDVLECLPIS